MLPHHELLPPLQRANSPLQSYHVSQAWSSSATVPADDAQTSLRLDLRSWSLYPSNRTHAIKELKRTVRRTYLFVSGNIAHNNEPLL